MESLDEGQFYLVCVNNLIKKMLNETKIIQAKIKRTFTKIKIDRKIARNFVMIFVYPAL